MAEAMESYSQLFAGLNPGREMRRQNAGQRAISKSQERSSNCRKNLIAVVRL
jgi:hypothetical protein